MAKRPSALKAAPLALLTREAILAADDKPTRMVPVPEWGGAVRIRSISAAERDEFEEIQLAARKEGRILPRQVRARMVAFCVVDEAGNRLFTEADVEALGAKGVRAVDRVCGAVAELNAFSDKDVEELAGN